MIFVAFIHLLVNKSVHSCFLALLHFYIQLSRPCAFFQLSFINCRQLGKVGDWVNRAEEMIGTESEPSDRPEENVAIIKTQLEEHYVSES